MMRVIHKVFSGVVTALGLFFFLLPVYGQESNVRLLAEVVASDGFGFENPVYGASVGATKKIRERFVVDLSGRVLRANKASGGGGYNVRVAGELRYMVKKPFSIVGGLAMHRQFTSCYEKVGSDPFFGVSVALPDDRTFIGGRLVGHDVAWLSRAQASVRDADLNFPRRIGFETRVEHYKPTSDRGGLYFAGTWYIAKFDCITGPTGGPTARCTGQNLNFKFGFYRR